MCQLQECFTVLVAFYVACTGTQMSVRAGNWLFAGVWLAFHKATAELWQCQDVTQQPCSGAGNVPKALKPIVLLMRN